MYGDLVVDTINGVNISVSPPATQAYANSLLAEYEVTGSAVTSIDFSGLDINTHKSYRVEIEWSNSTATNTSLYIFVNSDTVLTNYYSQQMYGSAATAGGNRVNSPAVVSNLANGRTSSEIKVSTVGGWVVATSKETRYLPSSLEVSSFGVMKTAVVTNITQLTFTSPVALALGIGSKIRIYRGDV